MFLSPATLCRVSLNMYDLLRSTSMIDYTIVAVRMATDVPGFNLTIESIARAFEKMAHGDRPQDKQSVAFKSIFVLVRALLDNIMHLGLKTTRSADSL